MGGKHWSLQEEEIFWTCIVPQSVKRIVSDPSVPPMSWHKLVGVMEAEMSARNQPPRRQYTGLSLFEHFFLNVDQRRFSPNARRFAQHYLRQRDLVKHNEKGENVEKTGPDDVDPGPESAPANNKKPAVSPDNATNSPSVDDDQATPGREGSTAPKTPVARVVRTSARNRESRHHPFRPVNPRGRAPVQRTDSEPYHPSQQWDGKHPGERRAYYSRDRSEDAAHRHYLDRNGAHHGETQCLAHRASDHPFHAGQEDYGPPYRRGLGPTHYQGICPDKTYRASSYATPHLDGRYEMSGALPAPSHLHDGYEVSQPRIYIREYQQHVPYYPSSCQQDPRAYLENSCSVESRHGPRSELCLPPLSHLLRIASQAPRERAMIQSPEIPHAGGPSHHGYPAHCPPPWREAQMPMSLHAYSKVAHLPVHCREVGPVQVPEEQGCDTQNVQRDDSTATDTTCDEDTEVTEVTDYDGDRSSVSVPSSDATP
ncbi:hypothetical protein ACRALDRAFT_1066839 [Sodiomyces alcalophilus JCM 7366]|uniref:uncharacterized protein n=1 Tax=Sodiomyces alcalophilus JCM 7366 TaxID=591952 RepID=UPI0039B5D80C